MSIRGHEIRSARLPNGLPVPVAAGNPVLFEGVGQDYISWTGGRLEGGGVRIGLSLVNLGAACKPGAAPGWRAAAAAVRGPPAAARSASISRTAAGTAAALRCWLLLSGDVIQVDDGNLKVRVTEVVGPASVRGVALNAHMLKEMALVQVRTQQRGCDACDTAGAPGACMRACVQQRPLLTAWRTLLFQLTLLLPPAPAPAAPAAAPPPSRHQVKHAYRHEATALSRRDRADVAFAATNRVAYLSVPFVRRAQDVLEVRRRPLLDLPRVPLLLHLGACARAACCP